MGKIKLFLVSLLSLSFLAMCTFINLSARAEETGFFIKDEFDVNSVSSSHAVKINGIAGDGNATHAAVPADEWGDPVKISEDAYLIYEIGNGTYDLTGLFLTLDGKVWGQNDDTAYAENKINVYIGNEIDSVNTLCYTKSAYGSTDRFEDEINLSEYVIGSKHAFLKIELVQSLSNCGVEGCKNGKHTCGSNATIATYDGYCNLHYIGTRIFKVQIQSNAPEKDLTQPVPNDFKYQLPEEIFAMDVYQFPKIEFTDNVDGITDYKLSYVDPYNNQYTLPLNATEFTPEFEGIYTFQIESSDASLNVYTDKFSLNAVIKPGNPIIYFENVPEKNGRVGNVYNIEQLKHSDKELYETEIVVKDPSGKNVETNGISFIPEMVGEYTILYSAKNDKGITKLFARVFVKYNTNGENPYDIAYDKTHWKGNIELLEEGGMQINGRCYSYLPFSLEEGIKLDLTLSKETGAWLGLYFTRTSHYGNYYFEDKQYIQNNVLPGLYILIYMDNDGMYYCNIDYMGLSGGRMVVANHSYCGGDNNEVTISIKKNDSSDAISFYVNGKRNENYELNNSVLASVISDNEGFTYVGFGNLLHGTPTLRKIDICDSKAPNIVINGTLPETAELNTTIDFPTISAIDEHDGEMPYTMNLYSPDGKNIDLSNKKVILDKEGIYYFVVSTKDLSNNEKYSIMEIKVGNTNKEKTFIKEVVESKGCKSTLSLSLTSILLLSVPGIAFLKRKKNER